jgi:hypothetical protein
MMSPSAERGASRLKVLLWLLALAVIVHTAVMLVPVYINAERLKDEMSMKAGFAQTLKDEDIIADLTKKATELDIPVGPEAWVLKRNSDGHSMTIGVSWDVQVRLFYNVYPPLTERTLHFGPTIKSDYARHF